MAQILDLATRNVWRNRRRSLTTMVAVAVGALSIVLFGGFVANIFVGIETTMVKTAGHIHVYRNGYFLFGSGDPSGYGIARYRDVMRLIEQDAEMKPMLEVVTPRLQLSGIAGNFAENVSKTFLGVGLVPSDRERMIAWDAYKALVPVPSYGLDDARPEEAVVGVGMARMLHLCRALGGKNCPTPPAKAVAAQTQEGAALAALATAEGTAEGTADGKGAEQAPAGATARIDLLAATASGAPNAVPVTVIAAKSMGAKPLDESFVVMPIAQAQRLVYGRGEPRATAIVLQLKSTSMLPAARARLEALFKSEGLDLEVLDFAQLDPWYNQVRGMFTAIFGFIAALMAVIVLFTVVNTMSMAVVERTREIGTLRALGMRRGAIRRLFLAEGAVLGLIGASLGVGLALLLAWLVNGSGMTWTPPNNVEPVPLLVRAAGSPSLLALAWAGLAAVAVLSSLFPANRAARLEIVEALRHA
ncbi:MAG: ABC transporter permease [Alphaproteobacteria bacterium]|nr:ABC transporter permease [Alphaproteobacteria bacterium]